MQRRVEGNSRGLLRGAVVGEARGRWWGEGAASSGRTGPAGPVAPGVGGARSVLLPLAPWPFSLAAEEGRREREGGGGGGEARWTGRQGWGGLRPRQARAPSQLVYSTAHD